jgi:hypothetical protein
VVASVHGPVGANLLRGNLVVRADRLREKHRQHGTGGENLGRW